MRTAAVTGAGGLIGTMILNKLLEAGWMVRVLTRSNGRQFSPNVTVIRSDINDDDALRYLVKDVDAIFHCAAELKNEKKMYSTNVEGTRKLLHFSANSNASYFCHISSAGVIGPTSVSCITEETKCEPKNLYEKTKYESELLVKNSGLDMSVCILRPTNVISSSYVGILSLAIFNGFIDKIKVHIKGNEFTHIVYAKDVANVALYFFENKPSNVEVYFVSYDGESNTIVNVYNLYQSLCNKNDRIRFSLPCFIPYLMRKIYRGDSLHGKVRFSNEKLMNSGFVFEYGVKKCLDEICKLRGS